MRSLARVHIFQRPGDFFFLARGERLRAGKARFAQRGGKRCSRAFPPRRALFLAGAARAVDGLVGFPRIGRGAQIAREFAQRAAQLRQFLGRVQCRVQFLRARFRPLRCFFHFPGKAGAVAQDRGLRVGQKRGQRDERSKPQREKKGLLFPAHGERAAKIGCPQRAQRVFAQKAGHGPGIRAFQRGGNALFQAASVRHAGRLGRAHRPQRARHAKERTHRQSQRCCQSIRAPDGQKERDQRDEHGTGRARQRAPGKSPRQAAQPHASRDRREGARDFPFHLRLRRAWRRGRTKAVESSVSTVAAQAIKAITVFARRSYPTSASAWLFP